MSRLPYWALAALLLMVGVHFNSLSADSLTRQAQSNAACWKALFEADGWDWEKIFPHDAVWWIGGDACIAYMDNMNE